MGAAHCARSNEAGPPVTWLGIDGEGIGRAPHRYVLLAASDSSGVHDYIENVNGIPTERGLRFLLSLPRRFPDARLAGFYLSYDWTMLLADLPNRCLFRLLRPEMRLRPRNEGAGFSPVYWRGFKLHYLSGMMRIARGDDSATIWDVGKFYQSRFVQALESAGLAPSELIARMKEERGTWGESDLDRMRDYCLEECRELSKLCGLLERQHESIGLSLRSWHGPGSTASALLAREKVERCHAKAPAEVEDLARRAFFGGRFEQARIGSEPGVWSYDVRSAYPHAASSLPCLAHAKWVHRRRAPREVSIALVRYRVGDVGERVWGPLPCRLPDGSIVWPRSGSSGWVWNVEFQAARAWRGVEYGGEHWELVRKCSCQPFAFVPDLYAARIARPENKQVLKLAMNSLYGKLAQSAGGGSRWSSRVWAGIITATTRARMLDLIRSHGDESKLVAIATDGAYSTERLAIDGAELGGWEVGEKGFMTFVRPGIYWSHADVLKWYGAPTLETRATATKAIRSRGIGRAHLLTQVSAAEAAIARGDERAELGLTTQFGGARETVYRTPSNAIKRSPLFGQWYEQAARLSLAPEPKRDAHWNPPSLDGIESAPYEPNKGVPQKLLRLIGSMLEGRIR